MHVLTNLLRCLATKISLVTHAAQPISRDTLCPEASQQEPSSTVMCPILFAVQVTAALFDWSQPFSGPHFDVVLSSDVLYENFSVEPVATVVPKLLYSNGGKLVLADPATRTEENRHRFLDLVQNAKRQRLQLALQESMSVEMDGWHDIEVMLLETSSFQDTIRTPS